MVRHWSGGEIDGKVQGKAFGVSCGTVRTGRDGSPGLVLPLLFMMILSLLLLMLLKLLLMFLFGGQGRKRQGMTIVVVVVHGWNQPAGLEE